MKKIFYLMLFTYFGFFGCVNKQEKVITENTEKDSLMNVISEKDSSILAFLNSFGEIQQNLDSILIREQIISSSIVNSEELKPNLRFKINNAIASINTLLKENRKKIAILRRNLNRKDEKYKQLELLVQGLNNQLAAKDSELIVLNNKLLILNTNMIQLQANYDTLNAISSNQRDIINEQTTALHTAYYIVGQREELREKNIINKSGGVLGLGKTTTASSVGMNNGHYTQIDYTRVRKIDINSRKAKIITTHPSDSYKLIQTKNKVDSIIITNPDKFWSASKYLIVVTHS